MGKNKVAKDSTLLLSRLEIIPSHSFTLSNGIPVLALHNEDYRLIRLDIRLLSKHDSQTKFLSNSATARTLFTGSFRHDRKQISEIMDFHGAYYDVNIDKDFTTFSVYFPKEAAKKIFALLQEVFTMPNFPEPEWNDIREKQKRELAIKLGRNSYVVFKEFLKTIFESHHYGRFPEYEDYDAVERKDLCNFYTAYYHASNMRLYIAGNIDKEIKTLLSKTFEQMPQGIVPEIKDNTIPIMSSVKKIIEKENALQSNIVIGKPLFNFAHADWKKFSVLNLILGGYFGSRLMNEIREKSGLAYSIYSSISSYIESGIFYISAHVNSDKTEQSLHEIYKVIEDISKTPIPEKELNLVKNYYYGNLLRDFDGVFSVLDRYMDVDDYGLTIDYWHDFLETIRQINSDDLLSLANTYLDLTSMTEIVVGKR